MNNLDKQYTDLIGDAYKNWKSNGRDFWEEEVDGAFTSELGEEVVDKISKEWFINKIKTDDEFAKKWGVKVEIRELSLEERVRLTINTAEYRNYTEEQWKEYIDTASVPKRVISLTYNTQTIEIYE